MGCHIGTNSMVELSGTVSPIADGVNKQSEIVPKERISRTTMTSWAIYHNAQCSKSSCALELLQGSGIEPLVVDYLREPPSIAELTELLAMLGIPAEQLVRKGEPVYNELYEGRELDEQGWIQAMHEHPELIERPIVVVGDKAVIGRPMANVQKLIDNK